MPKTHPLLALPALAAVAATLASCAGTPLQSEQRARSDLAVVSATYQLTDADLSLPVLLAQSPLAEYIHYAVLANPSVAAAFQTWAASVERVTVARSRPDPRLVFGSEVVETVTELMPGLMQEFPGAGKLRAAGDVAAHESAAEHAMFVDAVLDTVLQVENAYFRLGFLAETIRVERETLALLRELEQIAEQQNAAGMATVQDVLRAQIERERLETEVTNLEDSRAPLIAELKAALGIANYCPDPPAPAQMELSASLPDAEELLALGLAGNPELRKMAAEVLRAGAALELARKAEVSDFELGVEVNVLSPYMVRPAASVTLPIWRDKIAAEIAAAQADERAAEARLSAGQIRLAAELAMQLFLYRESSRNIVLLSDRLIPRARELVDAAIAAYVGGRSSFLDVIDAQRSLLAFSRTLIDARRDRELSVVMLSLSIAGVPPPGAPALDAPQETNR